MHNYEFTYIKINAECIVKAVLNNGERLRKTRDMKQEWFKNF